MRASLFVGLAAVAVGAVAFAALVGPDEDGGGRTLAEGVEAEDHPSPSARRVWPHDPDAEARVSELRESGKASDRRKLLAMYAEWGSDETKVHARMAVIDALLERRLEDPKAALKDLLAAIDADRELPGIDDPTVDYAAEKARLLWETPGMFEHGRDKLLTARTDKSRAVLADSLSAYASEGREFHDANDQRIAWLGSDLADAYSLTDDSWARETIRDGMRVTMGEDVAKVLVDPLHVDPKDLEALQEELEGVRSAVAELPDEAGGEAGHALEALGHLADEELVEAVDVSH